jgi:redox-sensitive bicupin YhaK (pirin superfamily)
MITIRHAAERGKADHGWLQSHHTFSFASYHDPEHMGFGPLRVINEDIIAGGGGFPTHPHSDMEILTFMLDGELAHRDSMGNGATIKPGDVQRMSAGTGIRHSEFNASETVPAHLLQIWLLPAVRGLQPSYEQKTFPEAEKTNQLRLIASSDGREESVTIHQDVSLYAGIFDEGQAVRHKLAEGRIAWLQVARGDVALNGETLHAGDAAAVSDTALLTLRGAGAKAEVLLFDMAG